MVSSTVRMICFLAAMRAYLRAGEPVGDQDGAAGAAGDAFEGPGGFVQVGFWVRSGAVLDVTRASLTPAVISRRVASSRNSVGMAMNV